jgi:hypothetical protein
VFPLCLAAAADRLEPARFPGFDPGHYASYRHGFIGGHDATGEFVADDLTMEMAGGSHDTGA